MGWSALQSIVLFPKLWRLVPGEDSLQTGQDVCTRVWIAVFTFLVYPLSNVGEHCNDFYLEILVFLTSCVDLP